MKSTRQLSLLNLSVEEENLAAIPFSVLERRVGKRIGKLEIEGSKTLPDGGEMRVVWQVQGNNELGLPTEQDLDIFVAFGTLTFRNNFAKTVTFQGREIAKILNIHSVNGKFYRRLKVAMDRFIPLRFRAIASTDQQEEVKWMNVFQEASFSLDRTTGRCVGSVTWTDKVIQSMEGGFFRLIDANRYMALDGLTSKHLYRFIAIAFEKSDLLVMDARKLAIEHLGIVNLPKYFSRLMQTLEPAFEQLMRIRVLGAFHIVSHEDWRIALHRHPEYVPERKGLLLNAPARDPEMARAQSERALARAGFGGKTATALAAQASTPEEFYALERAAHILQSMVAEEVLPHVAQSFVRRALEAGAAAEGPGRELLDWCEVALHVCWEKKKSRQSLKNSAGLLVKIVKDVESRSRLVSEEQAQALIDSFRQQEHAARMRRQEDEERTLVLEYEQFRERAARVVYDEMGDQRRAALRQEKIELLRQQERFKRLGSEQQQREAEELILHDLAKTRVPAFDKWLLRKRAQQAVLPLYVAAS